MLVPRQLLKCNILLLVSFCLDATVCAFTSGQQFPVTRTHAKMDVDSPYPLNTPSAKTGLRHAGSYQERANYKLLRVDNLQWYAEDYTLKNIFAPLGEAVDCYLARCDEIVFCMGYGFAIVPNEYINSIMMYIDRKKVDDLEIRVTEVDLEHLWTIHYQEPGEHFDWQ